MNQREKPEDRRRPRKPYVSPAVEESAEFETLAMMCGKDTPTLPSCRGAGTATS